MSNDTSSHGLGEFLRIEEENLQMAQTALRAVHPRTLEYIDAGIRLFDDLARMFGDRCGYDDHQRVLDAWVGQRPEDPKVLASLLDAAVLIGKPDGPDDLGTAKHALEAAKTVIARSYLILRFCRDYTLGIAEIFHWRITPSYGYLRVQTESVGLFVLMDREPSLASDWLDAVTAEQGIGFYKKWHSKLVAVIKEMGLYRTYEEGSAYALHSRIAGVGRGIPADRPQVRGMIRLEYQEVHDETRLFLYVCVYLRAHEQMVKQLMHRVPELASVETNTMFQEFGCMVENLWVVLRPRYAKSRPPKSDPSEFFAALV